MLVRFDYFVIAVLRVKEAESDPAWSTGDSWLHGMVDASRAADKNY